MPRQPRAPIPDPRQIDTLTVSPGDGCFVETVTEFYVDPACASGFSALATLVVPRPAPRYLASVSVLRSLATAYVSVSASPRGEDLPYRVCYRTKAKKQRCLNARMDGYSWDSRASDELRLNVRAAADVTTFSWFVRGRKVASKVVRVR